MANFETNKAYSLSNLSYCTTFNKNHYLTFKRSFYYKDKDHIFNNVKKLIFVFEDEFYGVYYNQSILLLDEEDNVVDAINFGLVGYRKKNSYYLSFVVDEVVGTMDEWLDDCGINEINVDENNASIFFNSGTIRPLGFEGEYKGSTYQNYINGLDKTIAPIELIPLIDYTLYKCDIKVVGYGTVSVGWDEETAELDITSLVVNQDTKIVNIGDLPIERVEDEPVGNLESFTIFCDAKNQSDKVTILFGGDHGIQTLDNEREYYDDNIVWGNDVELDLKVTNYNFTTESLRLIKEWIKEIFDGEVPNIEDFEITPTNLPNTAKIYFMVYMEVDLKPNHLVLS